MTPTPDAAKAIDLNWQPIKTAPKDGRPIWARGNNHGDASKGKHYHWAWWDGTQWCNDAIEVSILMFLVEWLAPDVVAQENFRRCAGCLKPMDDSGECGTVDDHASPSPPEAETVDLQGAEVGDTGLMASGRAFKLERVDDHLLEWLDGFCCLRTGHDGKVATHPHLNIVRLIRRAAAHSTSPLPDKVEQPVSVISEAAPSVGESDTTVTATLQCTPSIAGIPLCPQCGNYHLMNPDCIAAPTEPERDKSIRQQQAEDLKMLADAGVPIGFAGGVVKARTEMHKQASASPVPAGLHAAAIAAADRLEDRAFTLGGPVGGEGPSTWRDHEELIFVWDVLQGLRAALASSSPPVESPEP